MIYIRRTCYCIMKVALPFACHDLDRSNECSKGKRPTYMLLRYLTKLALTNGLTHALRKVSSDE